MSISKKKIRVGDSVKVDSLHLVVEELFIADYTRWVRCSSHRKSWSVTYNDNGVRRKFTYYDSNTHYFTEKEWIRKQKTI